MDGDELGGLSREELLELMRRQREELVARAADGTASLRSADRAAAHVTALAT